MKTSELTGPALDWAVAKCEGLYRTDPEVEIYVFLKNHDNGFLHYSTDWCQGGPIIEREGIDIQQVFGGGCEGAFAQPVGWAAKRYVAGGPINPPSFISAHGPLIAAMRCFVSSRLGNEVEIPEELL